MPYSSGTYSLPSGNPVVTGTTISSSTTNTTNSDIATALSTCVLKDGTQTITANLPMASHKLTGLSAGTTAGDSVEYGGSPSFTNLAYTGTLTGSTGVLAIGTNQIYKDASGNVGIGTSSPVTFGGKLSVVGVGSTQSTVMVQNPGQGICHLGFASTGSNVKLYNCYATGTLAGGAGIDIDSSGNLLVGTTSVIANGKINSVFDQASASGIGLKNTSATATGYYCAFYNSAGTLQGSITQASSTVTAYNVTSDKRLKIDKGVATDTSVIDKTTIHDFEWKADGVLDRGVFAQEAQLVKPSAVTKGKDDVNKEGDIVHPWAVDYSKYVPDLIVYCQQLKKQNQEQQTLIEALTARLTKAGL